MIRESLKHFGLGLLKGLGTVLLSMVIFFLVGFIHVLHDELLDHGLNFKQSLILFGLVASLVYIINLLVNRLRKLTFDFPTRVEVIMLIILGLYILVDMTHTLYK
jgi:hypothetical protein